MYQMHEYAQIEYYNIMRNLTGSQCRLSDTGVMCFSCSGAGDESGSRILDTLQWIN